LWPLFAFQLPLTLISGQTVLRHAASSNAQPEDRYPPVIKLHGLAAEQVIYYNSLFIEGRVTDDSGITAFSIDGESFWSRPVRQLFFNYLAPLTPGANRFVLEAFDNAGRISRQEILVTYIVPEIERFDSRLRVAVFPPEKKGETTAMGEAVYASLHQALEDQGRFVVIERENLDKVLRELKLSQTELVDPETAARAGKIEAAEGLLIGTVIETGQALTVLTRFVDVETAVVMAALDVYGEDLNLHTLKELMEGLAWKVRQRFPIVEGVILDREGDLITTNLAHKDGIQEHMKLILFREGESIRDPNDGKIKKKPDQRMGEARVEEVSDELSEAALLEPQTAENIHPLDKVITK